MKKNKLIALLQNIKGNPEIRVWDGTTEQDVRIDKIQQYKLARMKKQIQIEFAEIQGCSSTEMNRSWALEYGLEDEDIYEFKSVLMITTKDPERTPYGGIV